MVCVIEPQVLDVFIKWNAKLIDEEPAEIFGRIIQRIGYIGNRDRFTEMLLNVLQDHT